VDILYAFPGRTYDVSDERFLDRERVAVSLALAANPTAGTPTAAGTSSAIAAETDARSEQQERRRYLARINKTASFVDYTDQAPTFGWYFYPSNVVVEKKWHGGFEARGYLEPGARDCAVWISVPVHTKSIELELSTVLGRVDRGSYDTLVGQDRRVTISLPPYHPFEQVNLGGAFSGGSGLSPLDTPGRVSSSRIPPIGPGPTVRGNTEGGGGVSGGSTRPVPDR
jgi:hypothetical protein